MNMQGVTSGLMQGQQSLQISQDNAQFAASTGLSASGVANSLNSLGGLTPYTWTEPKTGIIATLLPGDGTWHPLYDHDYVEIANHMVDVLGSPNFDQPTKTQLLGRIKDVTIESYEVKTMGYFYQLLIAGIVIGIVLLILGFSVFEYPKIILVWLAFLGCIFGYSKLKSRPDGEAYWTTFISDFTSKANSGMTPAKILESYGSDLNREKDRASMARANANHNQSSGTLPFVGAMAGSFIGNMLGVR